MKIISAKIQNYESQTGILSDPLFLWKYDEGQESQSAYEIEIFDGDELIHTTGKVASREQNSIPVNACLRQMHRYEYVITAWNEGGTVSRSERFSFLTGAHTWSGKWITNRSKKPFDARKTLLLDHAPREAVICICVPGQFELKINGSPIENYAYLGSQTDFHKHIHYYTVDITQYLYPGSNEIYVQAANGWYIGDTDGERHFYTMGMGYEPFGEYLTFSAQILTDGRMTITDSSWEISASQVTLANIYGSEDIDHTVEYDWNSAVELEDHLPQGTLIPMTYPPVIRKQIYSPVHVDRERMIFDFGQNMTSQFKIRLHGQPGQKISLIPAEKLDSSGNIEQTVNTYSILTPGSTESEEFEQKFSLCGARWYQITGADYKQIESFTLSFVTSGAQDCGSFACSDNTYNSIYDLILKAMESNLNHSHTDCPTIEKLGWLEPNHLMARAVMYNKTVDTLWSKIAMDMRDAQYRAGEKDIDQGSFPHVYSEGLIPSIAPRYARFLKDWNHSGSFWDIIPWGSSIILAALEQYRFYGNKQVLEDNYEAARSYVSYLTNQYNDYNEIYHKTGEDKFICCGLGDWGTSQNKGECRENIETAFYFHNLMCMAEISNILHREDEFSAQARKVKSDYNSSLLRKNPATGLYCYFAYDKPGFEVTQANQAIPLHFGLVPEEYALDVQKSLIKVCEGEHIRTGEIGLPYVIRELSAAGRNDIIHSMILQKEHPSYARFIEMGETTLPEFWRDDARSRNHDMLGHIMEWFYTDVLGITSTDGFRTIAVCPKCRSFIKSAKGSYDSIRGKITVEYDEDKLTVTTPANTIAVIR